MKIGDKVIDRYGQIGQISSIVYGYWNTKPFLTMTKQNWLDQQIIPFTDEQLIEQWAVIALDNGGEVLSPLSLLQSVGNNSVNYFSKN